MMRLSLQNNILFGFLLFNACYSIAGVMGETTIKPYDGFYIGGDIGVADLIDSESSTSPPISHHLSATGLIGGGLLGYDYSFWEHFKFGVEGFINANELTVRSSQDYAPAATYKVHANYTAGVRVLPGYELLPNTFAHLLIGYSNLSVNIKDNGNYGFINQNAFPNGFQCGLGMKTALISGLSIRADALYSVYGRLSNIGTNTLAVYPNQTYVNNLSTIEGDLTLLYKFVG